VIHNGEVDEIIRLTISVSEMPDSNTDEEEELFIKTKAGL